MFEKLKGIIAEQLGVEIDEINPESNITEDLGADSLDIVELVMALEEAFDVDISDEAVTGMKTVQDIMNFIQSKS